MSLLQHLKESYFVDGGNGTKAGMIDYLFENQRRYLLIDEIDKISAHNQTFLLNLMETGIISEAKYGKTRETKIHTSVFATSNGRRSLSGPLQPRFFVVELEPYTYQQIHEIAVCLLNNQSEVAPIIADAVWNTSKNIRDCIRIGRLARTVEDVNFLIQILGSRRALTRLNFTFETTAEQG